MGIYIVNTSIKPTFTFAIVKKDCIFFLSFVLYLNIAKFYVYSSLPNRRGARNKRGGGWERWAIFNKRGVRNKRGGGKDEPLLISMVPGISMVVRIFRPVTTIKRRKKMNKISN